MRGHVDDLRLLPGVLVVVAQALGVDHLGAVDEHHGLVVDGEEQAGVLRLAREGDRGAQVARHRGEVVGGVVVGEPDPAGS
jgi:hypothetical protein